MPKWCNADGRQPPMPDDVEVFTAAIRFGDKRRQQLASITVKTSGKA